MSFTNAKRARVGGSGRAGGGSGWTDVYLASGARAVSAAGDLLAVIALVLELQQRGMGGFAVAALLIAEAVPPVLLVRWAGRLADRVDSRWLLILAGLAQAAVCVGLAFASGLAEIIALIAVLAAGLALTQPCLSALVPEMVGPDDLPRATALSQTAAAAGTMLAPALAGVLMGHFGLRVPLLADAATYLAIAVAGGLIRTRRGGRAQPVTQPVTQPAGQKQETGWRLRQDQLVWAAVVLIGAVVTAAGLVNVAEVFLIRGTLHASATVYGLLDSVWIASTVAGAWLLARRRPADWALGRALLGTLALTCLSVAAFAVVPAVGWLVPVSLLGGLGNGGVNNAAGVLIGRRAPAAARGQAFAVLGAVASAATTVGYLLGGLLLALIPVRPAIAVAGLAGLAVTAAFALPVLRASRRERAQAQTQTEPQPRLAAEPSETTA
ncbi:MAG TPA: MFS transporter [Streptosporangiaceae bacterium]|nr:MFS transporter [Streptosporangiaceae bacterium]